MLAYNRTLISKYMEIMNRSVVIKFHIFILEYIYKCVIIYSKERVVQKMIDFNYESLDELLKSNIYHYEVEEMIDLLKIYFKDRTRLEPRLNETQKESLIFDIIEMFKKMNKICKEELAIAPILDEPLKKTEIHNLVYKFFEYTMDFNNPNSKYMSKKGLGFDEEYFAGVACYICENCGYSIEIPAEAMLWEKEKKGHIGIKCNDCNNTVFPIFIRDKDRKVIMKE